MQISHSYEILTFQNVDLEYLGQGDELIHGEYQRIQEKTIHFCLFALVLIVCERLTFKKCELEHLGEAHRVQHAQ